MRSNKSVAIRTIVLAIALASASSTAICCTWIELISTIDESADPLFPFVKDKLTGYIDRTGKIVIPARLSQGGPFHNGLLNLFRDGSPFVDSKGNRISMANVYQAEDFSEGLAIAQQEKGGKSGFIDTTGKYVIPPKFDAAPYDDRLSSFSNGYAAVKTGEQVGYINRNGDFAIAPRFLRGKDFKEDRAWVIVDGPCLYLLTDSPCNDEVVVPESARPRQNSLPLCKYALIDKAGTIVSSARFDDVRDFSEDLAPVLVSGNWGYVDKSGRITITPRFAIAEKFHDGLALIGFRSNRTARAGVEYGYINRSGVVVIPAKFARADSFSEGLAAVADSLDGPYYYIDKTPRRVIPQTFSRATPFVRGLAHVRLSPLTTGNGEYGYVNRSGNIVFTYSR
jgi:hypothetical protein